jgi:hypothetical protein
VCTTPDAASSVTRIEEKALQRRLSRGEVSAVAAAAAAAQYATTHLLEATAEMCADLREGFDRECGYRQDKTVAERAEQVRRRDEAQRYHVRAAANFALLVGAAFAIVWRHHG